VITVEVKNPIIIIIAPPQLAGLTDIFIGQPKNASHFKANENILFASLRSAHQPASGGANLKESKQLLFLF